MAVELADNVMPRSAQDAPALRRIFTTLTAESCPQSFNFHMHTVCSDGRLAPEQLIEQAVQIGLQGLAITDHHSVSGYQRAQQWLRQWQASTSASSVPHLWTGVEISAVLLNEEVHLLGYAFDPQHIIMQPYLTGNTPTGELYQSAQVIAAIHQAGGLVVLAHPARYRRSHHDLIPAAADLGVDGVETYYAYGNPSPWKPSPRQTQEIGSLSHRHNLLNTCGTDSHGLTLLQRL
jgi:predicted metal-dependent phosphoesterase TrpH